MSAAMPCGNTASLNQYEANQDRTLKQLEADQRVRDRLAEEHLRHFEQDPFNWFDLLSPGEREEVARDIIWNLTKESHYDAMQVVENSKERLAKELADQEMLR